MGTIFVQPGCSMEFTAPAGGVTVNVPVLIGGLFVIPTITAAAAARFNGLLEGVFVLPKATGEVWTEGAPAYWDVANGRASFDSTVGLQIGAITSAALTGDTTGFVRLNEASLSGGVLNLRKHLTVAAINAGAPLLPAIAGAKYRLIDAYAIAIGGAVGAVTTVDVIGTLGTARKLVAFGQAALTQSALVRAGSAGGVILADGASFTANDAGTAITAGITGSAITGATHVDFQLLYAIE
jgi:predicted RecA/RadA family phage recombinase